MFGEIFPKNKTKYTWYILPSSDIYILFSPYPLDKVSMNNNEGEVDLQAYQGIESYKDKLYPYNKQMTIFELMG